MSGKPETQSKGKIAFEEAKLMMLSKADLMEKCVIGANKAASRLLKDTFHLVGESGHTDFTFTLEKELLGGLFTSAVNHINGLHRTLRLTDKEGQKIILGALDPGTGKTNQYILGTTRSVIKTIIEGANIEIRSEKNANPILVDDGHTLYTFHSHKSERGIDVPFWDTAASDQEMALEKLYRVITRRLHAELEFNVTDPEQAGLVRGAYADVLPGTPAVALSDYTLRLLEDLMPFELAHLAALSPQTNGDTSKLTAFAKALSVEQHIALINMTVAQGKVKIKPYDVAAIKASITPQWAAVEESIKIAEASFLGTKDALQSERGLVSLDW